MKNKQNNKSIDLKTEVSNLKTSKKEILFKGRISRSQFAWSYFMLVLINILAYVYSPRNDWGLIFIVSIVTVIFTASLIVQRLHDLGRSGYYYWLILIPIYNIIFILFDLCGKKGQININKYGNNPLNN